jgi:hypothetical protein
MANIAPIVDRARMTTACQKSFDVDTAAVRSPRILTHVDARHDSRRSRRRPFGGVDQHFGEYRDQLGAPRQSATGEVRQDSHGNNVPVAGDARAGLPPPANVAVYTGKFGESVELD